MVYESHRKVILLRITVYEVVYEYFGISALHEKKSRILMYSDLFFCCVHQDLFIDPMMVNKSGYIYSGMLAKILEAACNKFTKRIDRKISTNNSKVTIFYLFNLMLEIMTMGKGGGHSR